MGDGAALLGKLGLVLHDLDPGLAAPKRLERLIAAGVDRLPLPGGGHTLTRWRALAAVASTDLSLAKLYEGHTDALAILAELGTPMPEASTATWGVWAAEAPQGRTLIETCRDGSVTLRGTKCWCSGAGSGSDAVLTAWHPDGRGPQLVRVSLRQPGVTVNGAAWQAVGMAGSASLDVDFDGARGATVGGEGDYLHRPGFWQGGAGIAACWYGGSVGIAEALKQSMARADATAQSPFRLAALGRIDIALQSTAEVLRAAAAWIDANPDANAREVALRARLGAEQGATRVLDEAGRAMGAGPYCRDARFARAAADLPVFIRQSHGDRDLAALGELVAGAGATPWML